MMLKIKPFKETKGYCGAASLKIVMEYFGVKKTEKEIARLARTSKKLGTSVEGILRAGRYYGFRVQIKDNATFYDIQKWLNKKIPVIVDWFSAEGGLCDGHYSPVMGLDKRFIYLQDPELGKMCKLERNYFMRVWFDFPDEYMRDKKDLILRRIIIIYK